MAKIPKKTIENIRDILNRGCEYAATQEIVKEIADETLKDFGCEICQSDDAAVFDWDDDEVCTLDDYANAFWDKAVEKFMNILETEE